MPHEYWQYFLAIEADLDAATRYVEPCSANFPTYSIEFAKLLLTACSEVDVVAKLLCAEIDPAARPRDIDDHRALIMGKYPKFHTIKVLIPRFSLDFEPWAGWDGSANPPWWRAHNQVKHFRHQKYAGANLENCLGAVTGLFALLLYFYHEDLLALRLKPEQKLLALPMQPDALYLGKSSLPDFP